MFGVKWQTYLTNDTFRELVVVERCIPIIRNSILIVYLGIRSKN
jgi:hypothetical protein